MMKNVQICLIISILFVGTPSIRAQYWNTNGNSATRENFLGTTNDTSLIFKTNGETKMTLLPLNWSSIGIGTEAPNGNLHIHSTRRYLPPGVVSPTYLNTFLMTNTATGEDEGFVIAQKGKDITLHQQASGYLNIMNNSGEFGISGSGDITMKPSQNINVIGNILILKGNSNGSILFGGNSAGSNCTYGAWGIRYVNTTAEGAGLNFWKTENCGTGFDHVLFLADNGNVGIGVKNPQAKLTVNGNICAKEIKVSLMGAPCWPDFVFSDNYKLPSLQETEHYIKANRHLPNVPSAAEVEQNGIALGEMNALLLQKIEELTLYVIDLQKQIDELKKEQEEKE